MMSAGFIPMVSTTPPPIDDDNDFTDFMDGNADFDGFSSPVDEEDFSYPSLNSPPESSHSLSFHDENLSPHINAVSKSQDFEIIHDKETCKEVENILQASENSKTKVTEELTNGEVIESSMAVEVGDTVELDDTSVIKTDIETKQQPYENPDAVLSNGLGETPENKDGGSTDNEDSELDDWMDYSDALATQDEKIEVKSKVHADVEEDSPEQDVIDDVDEQLHNDDQTSNNIEKDDSSERSFEEFNEHSIQQSAEDFAYVSVNDEKLENSVSEIQQDSIHETLDDHFDNFQDAKTEESNFNQHESLSDVKDEQVDTFDPSGDEGDTFNPSDDEFADFNSTEHFVTSDETFHADDEKPSINQGQADAFDCDFGAFDSAPAGAFDSANDGGFADFSQADDTSETPSKRHHSESKNSDFGDFATENDQDDFGDFNSGSASSWDTSATTQTVTKVLTNQEKIKNYICKYARRKESEGEIENIFLLDERMKTDVLSKDPETHSTISSESIGISWPGELWDQLEDIDNTIALKFIWNGSGHNKHLLDSLGMHTQNILFSGAKQAYYVPTYYAAGLGLMDPSKGILKPMSAAEKITALSPTEKNASVKQDEIISPTEPYPQWKNVAEKHGRNDGTVLDGSGSLSSNGSGTNNSGFATLHVDNYGNGTSQSASDVPVVPSTMDLDYFDSLLSVQASTKPPGNSDLIDQELLELTTAPTTDPPPPPKDSGSATLSKILASIKGAGNSTSVSMTTISMGQDEKEWEEEENKLSAEARSVLQRLPDLFYMRSKVLMFPINLSRVNMDEDV